MSTANLTEQAMQQPDCPAQADDGKPHATRRRVRNLDLTPVERDALIFAAKGFTDMETAGHLRRSHHTIKDVMKRVLRKLDVDTRIEAAVHAAKQGWV